VPPLWIVAGKREVIAGSVIDEGEPGKKKAGD
jgi:hypothetical protein